ncbi:hypothetical protein HAX54_048147, partial [Datura stramonium]|nr:hypothetical protein [Datura stramonium]
TDDRPSLGPSRLGLLNIRKMELPTDCHANRHLGRELQAIYLRPTKSKTVRQENDGLSP